MKSLFKIHPFFYIFMGICLFTGNIKDFIVFSFIIFVHEFGHISAGLLFGWKIEKVILFPLGGLTIFNVLVNTSLFEQFIVAVSGPIFQVVFYFFLKNFYFSSRLEYLNFILLFFNLLPIYPFDGSKILFVFFNLIFSFKFSHLLMIFISFVFIFFLFFYEYNFVLFFALIFLLFKNVQEFRLHRFIFNKFLFERYMYNLSFRRLIFVKNVNSMRIWAKHLIFSLNSYETEEKILSKRFDK